MNIFVLLKIILCGLEMWKIDNTKSDEMSSLPFLITITIKLFEL